MRSCNLVHCMACCLLQHRSYGDVASGLRRLCRVAHWLSHTMLRACCWLCAVRCSTHTSTAVQRVACCISQVLASSCMVSAFCCTLSVACCPLGVAGCLLSAARCLPSAACRMLRGVCCLGACCPLHAVCCLLHGVCCMSSAAFRPLQVVCCLLNVVVAKFSICLVHVARLRVRREAMHVLVVRQHGDRLCVEEVRVPYNSSV